MMLITRLLRNRVRPCSARGPEERPIAPKSRTAQEIAWQIVCEEKMLIDALESGKAEWAPAPTPDRRPQAR